MESCVSCTHCYIWCDSHGLLTRGAWAATDYSGLFVCSFGCRFQCTTFLSHVYMELLFLCELYPYKEILNLRRVGGYWL